VKSSYFVAPTKVKITASCQEKFSTQKESFFYNSFNFICLFSFYFRHYCCYLFVYKSTSNSNENKREGICLFLCIYVLKDLLIYFHCHAKKKKFLHIKMYENLCQKKSTYNIKFIQS